MKHVLLYEQYLTVSVRDWLLQHVGGIDCKWSYDSTKQQIVFHRDEDATYFTMMYRVGDGLQYNNSN